MGKRRGGVTAEARRRGDAKEVLPNFGNYISSVNKRIFDIVAAFILLLITCWLFIVIILLYVLTFQFPIFFVQKRIGRDERVFKMIKFRTLRPGARPGRERRFLLGDVLRFFSLDELPQLLNVMAGDMSLVGPRPLPVEYLPRIPQPYQRRHSVRPGITGWAQINGRHQIPWEEKFRLDLYYIDTWSMLLDLKIVVKTVGQLLALKRDVSLEERGL